MAKNIVNIDFQPIPVIGTVNSLLDAAHVLEFSNAAYVIPEIVESESGPPLRTTEKKVEVVRQGLNMASKSKGGFWIVGESSLRTVIAETDLGVHSNPWDLTMPPDYIHYHDSPRIDGEMRVTMMDPQPAYMRRGANRSPVDRRLTQLLAEGQTDPRYVKPDTVRQAVLHAGQAVLFRLNEGPGGPALIHEFRTEGGGSRDADITPIFRVQPARLVLLSLVSVPEMDEGRFF